MLIFAILFLLLSNAVTLRRDKSILFSRVAIIVLLYSSLIVAFIRKLKTNYFFYLYDKLKKIKRKKEAKPQSSKAGGA
jgi:hypothetical protein